MPPAGTTVEDAPTRHVLLLVLLCAGLWGWTGGLWDIWGGDEARYIQVARELVHRDNWFYLTVFDQAYDQKPPMAFWLMAGMLKLSGGALNTFLVRFPSVLFGTLMVVLTYLVGRARLGPRAGLLSALVLLTSPLMLTNVPAARLDAIYAGWTTLALFAWLATPERGGWARALLFGVALSGAFLTKGPPAFVVVLLVVVIELIATRQAPFTLPQSLVALGLVILTIAGWLWAERQTYGYVFVQRQVFGETVSRFVEGNHGKEFSYYFPELFVHIFPPWTFFLVAALVSLWRRRGEELARLRPFLSWGLVPLVFFSLASGKRPAYLLPLLPGMALLVGWYLDTGFLAREKRPWLARGLGMPAVALGAAVLVAAVLLVMNPAWETAHKIAVDAPRHAAFFLIGLGLIAAGIVLLRGHGRSGATLRVMFAVMLAGSFSLYTVINPIRDPRKTSRAFGEGLTRALREADAGMTVVAVGEGDKPEYHIYGNYWVVPLGPDTPPVTSNPLPRVLLGRTKDWRGARDWLGENGYRLLYTDRASSDEIEVYLRGK